MTVIKIKGRYFNNPVEYVLARIGGKWKMPILWRLKDRTWRYNELKKDIPGITYKMLTQQLRELEEDLFISRKIFAEIPPKVEYSLTKKGERAIPIVITLRNWGLKLFKEEQKEISDELRDPTKKTIPTRN